MTMEAHILEGNIVLIDPTVVKIEPAYYNNIEEEEFPCSFCEKVFASTVALNNHLRLMHTSKLMSMQQTFEGTIHNTITNVKKDKPSPKKRPVRDLEAEQRKKEEFLSTLKPVDLMTLASEDVSYIIIKSEENGETVSEVKKKKGTEAEKKEVAKRQYTKREKEPVPITGPFECLQPSTMVANQICHQIFFSCCEYSTHHRDDHTKRRKGQRCQVCEKPLAPLYGEENIKLFSCQVCNKEHNTNRELQEHIDLEHAKLRPFHCSICSKRFTQQGGLIQHMRMHTGERPFPCTYCHKAFTQKSGLEQHLRTHTKVKPYRCVVCQKSFCQSIHLKQHMRLHTNVAPFQCGICQDRFKQSSHLNYHLKSHNEAEMTDEQRQKLARLITMSSERENGVVETEEIVVVEENCRDDVILIEQGYVGELDMVTVQSADGYH